MRKDLGSNANINNDYFFMKDERKWCVGIQISGEHNSR